MLRGVGEVCDGGLSGGEFVRGDEGHGDLHGGVPGDGSSIHEPSDDGGHTDSLHEGLSDGFLQLLGLVLGEQFVDVDDEPGVELVDELVVAGEHLDVGVPHEGGVDLGHVLLNDRSTGHGVVDGLQVGVDGLGGDLLSEPPLDGLVRGVESDEDGPPDVVPGLLDGAVVDAVQVVRLGEDVGVGQLVGHPAPLSEGHSDVLVHHGDSALLGDLHSGVLELHLGFGLLPSTVAVVLGGHVGGVFFEFLLACFHEQLLFSCHGNHSPLTFQGW